MKRFYKKAESGTAPGGFVVRLDGKTLKTPLQNNIILASKPLAEAMAEEWRQQGEEVNPSSMPLNQLVNTMIDKSSGDDRGAMNEEVLKFAGSDLLCYFADHPQDIVARQRALWLPLLEWMEKETGVKFASVSGIRYHKQSDEALLKTKRVIETLDPAGFTVVQAITALTGSIVIALALQKKHITVDDAYHAACVDEIYQLEKWGADAAAQKRLDRIRADIRVIEKFRDLITATS